MVAMVKTVNVEPGSELARLLEDAGERPLVLIKGSERFRVTREAVEFKEGSEDPWTSYDPERLEEGLQRVQGMLSHKEAEEWIADIYRWREEGSRPPDRP